MSNIAPIPIPLSGEAARAFPRKNLFLMAILVNGTANHPVKVRNLSASGALLEAPNLPTAGTAIGLKRGSLQIEGTLVWKDEQRGGIRFSNPINLSKWIPGASSMEQLHVDFAVAEMRKSAGVQQISESSDLPNILDSGLLQRIAEELACVSRGLESLGNDLANEPQIVARHLGKLQQLDVSGQILDHLARLLAAPSPEGVLSSIGMADLRRRLERTSALN